MNIYEKHLVEVREAQIALDQAVLKLHDVYADSVQASREALLHALTGDKTPRVDMGALEAKALGPSETSLTDNRFDPDADVS